MNNSVDFISKWAAGPSYGPVLSQTDLYLLDVTLELHPIMRNDDTFHLLFNLQTGETGGFNENERDRDLAFVKIHEPATIPRVSQLHIISHVSPWCHKVANPTGVTMGDICNVLTEDFTKPITDTEMTAIPARLQDQINRFSASRAQNQAGQWGAYYTPHGGNTPKLRADWLKDRHFFERLVSQEDYVKTRLGFSAPNIFVMELVS